MCLVGGGAYFFFVWFGLLGCGVGLVGLVGCLTDIRCIVRRCQTSRLYQPLRRTFWHLTDINSVFVPYNTWCSIPFFHHRHRIHQHVSFFFASFHVRFGSKEKGTPFANPTGTTKRSFGKPLGSRAQRLSK